MIYESIMEKLLDEDNDEIIELQPEGGQLVKFEQVAVVVYQGNPYAILRPLEAKDEQVVVFKLNPDDEDDFEIIDDQKVANAVLKVFEDEIEEYESEPELDENFFDELDEFDEEDETEGDMQ